MINRLHIREALAWTAVLIALVLLTTTVAFSQTRSVNVTNENGKVHISTKVTENGKTITRDTTFEADDNTDIDKIVDQFTGMENKKGAKKEINIQKKNKNGTSQKRVMIDMDIPQITDADKAKIHSDIQKSMDQMREGLKEMHKSLENMSIHINDDDNDLDFNFDFGPGHDDFDIASLEGIDSLQDKDRIVVVIGDNEKPPVLDTIIKKNGKQVLIYKRVNPEPKQKDESRWIEKLQCYPNPSSGKVNVRFRAPESLSLSIDVTDSRGKSVYSEKLDDFTGVYSKEIDLTNKGKGTYLLTISDPENSITKKLIIN